MAVERPPRVFLRPCPEDFAVVFVQIGRLECEEHYQARRDTVTRWLNECGAAELIDQRWQQVLVNRAAKARQRQLRREVARMLHEAYPVDGISIEVAEAAAQHLRLTRNGGWPVSRAGDGLWWVGTQRRTVEEMVAFAVRKGFDATLSGEGGSAVDCGRP
jgi:hypothetical protein